MSAWAVEGRRRPRGVRAFALAAALAALGAVIVLGTWRFISPPASASALSEVRLAAAGDFALGSVTGYRITSEGDVDPFVVSSNYLSLITSGSGRINAAGVFYVVHLPDGDFRVLAGRSTHLGGLIVWNSSDDIWSNSAHVGVFVEPAHSEQWTIDGTRLYGPAPRDLDRYEWYVDDTGVLVLDLSEVVRGVDGSPLPPLYDVNDPGWPTSGWPTAATD